MNHTTGIISGAKRRNDRTIDDDARKRIRHRAFEAISDLNAHFSIIGCYDQQDAIIFLALTQRPGPEQAIGIGFDILAVQARNRHHHHLIGRFRFKIGEFLRELLPCCRVNNTGCINHAPGQNLRRLCRVLRICTHRRKDREQKRDKSKQVSQPVQAAKRRTHGKQSCHGKPDQLLKLTWGAVWLPASALNVCIGTASRYQIHVQIIVGMVRIAVLYTRTASI